MKACKRIISAALSLVFLVSVIPQTVFAEEGQNTATANDSAQVAGEIDDTEEEVPDLSRDEQLEMTLPQTEQPTVAPQSETEPADGAEPQAEPEQTAAPEPQSEAAQADVPASEQADEGTGEETAAADEAQQPNTAVQSVANAENRYEVSSAAELEAALTAIEQSASAEAELVLTADLTGAKAFVGIPGKHITVKSSEGQSYKIYVGHLAGDCTFDNVTLTSTVIYANGHKAIFTEHVTMNLDALYGGSYQEDVENTYLVVRGGHIGYRDFSLVGGGNGYTVKHDVYLEVGGNAIVEKLMTGANTSGTGKPIGGNVTIVYDRPTDAKEVEAGKFGDCVSISGTYCNEIMGDLNLTVKSGYVKGIDAQRGDAPTSNIHGNVHIVAGAPEYEHTDTVLRLVGNWSVYGAGSQADNIFTSVRHTVGGNVTVDTYENLWGWGGASNTQTQDYPPEIVGAARADVQGDITINTHGSHMSEITGVEEGSANNITINAVDAELDDMYDTSYIYPLSEGYAKGDVTVNMDGGCVAQINCSDGTTEGKTAVNLTGNPRFIDQYGVWGRELAEDGPADQSVLTCDQATTQIPIIGYFSQVYLTNQSDVTLGNNHTKPFATGSIYDVTIQDSTLTTDNQAWAKGNVTMNSGTWTANGYVYVDHAMNTQNSNLTFHNYVALGYAHSKDAVCSDTVVTSKNDTYSFQDSNYVDKIYGNAAADGSVWNVLSLVKVAGNYNGIDNKLVLPTFVGDENYPDSYIPLEIVGVATGKTNVTLCSPDDPSVEGQPMVGQNYINAQNISEDVFLLANETAKPEGLFFKKVADADQTDKAGYDMWQVAKRENYPVIYTFVSGTDERELPAEVKVLLPVDAAEHLAGSTITAVQPEKTKVDVADGVWMFAGYDAGSKAATETNADEAHQIPFVGTWIFQANAAPLNKAPEIDADDLVLTEGDKLDLLDGVTALDAEDGDLTEDVIVLHSTVDTTKAGTYEVTYQVTDHKGVTTTKTIRVTVENVPTAPEGSAQTPDKHPQQPTKPQQPDAENPQTGDVSGVGLWTVLFAVSAGALTLLVYKKKKAN